jgi:uncharacterized RDD family membrane protein YckC
MSDRAMADAPRTPGTEISEDRRPAIRPYPYAGFWIRAAARILDFFAILASYNLFYLLYRLGADSGLWLPLAPDEGILDGGFRAERALAGIFLFGFPIFYHVYLHGAYGQTFGKMALRIKVVNEDGSPIGYRKAFLRWLGYFLSGGLTLYIGYLWAAFDPRKQALHDKVVRTLVIHTSAGDPRAIGGPPAAPDRT